MQRTSPCVQWALILVTAILGPAVSAAGQAQEPSDARPLERYGPHPPLAPAALESLRQAISWESNDTATGVGSPDALKGGSIRLIEGGFPPTLRFIGKNARLYLTRNVIASLCYESLLGLHPVTLNYIPQLARRWSMERDMRTFYFQLDARARFGDGTPVTADDVVATWDLCVDDGLEDPETCGHWRAFERPEALARDLVRVRAREASWHLFLRFALELPIFPHRVLESMNARRYVQDYDFKLLPGSGPYTLESVRPQAAIVLRKEPSWWASPLPQNRGLANFDTIELAFDVPTRRDAKMEGGQIDVIPIGPGVRRETLPGRGLVQRGLLVERRIYNSKPRFNWQLVFNDMRPPLDDTYVRAALCYLLDRSTAQPRYFASDSVFIDSLYPGSIYENPDNPKVRYSYRRAVALLEQAGWLQKNRDADGWLVKDGKKLEVTVMTEHSPWHDNYLTMYRQDLLAVGIKLDVEQVSWAEHVRRLDSGDYMIADCLFSSALFPDPATQIHWPTVLRNRRFRELVEREKVTFDRRARAKIIQEIDGLVCRRYLAAFLFYSPFEGLLYRNKFGMPESVLMPYDDYHALLWYWWNDPAKVRDLAQAQSMGTALPIPAVDVDCREKPVGEGSDR